MIRSSIFAVFVYGVSSFALVAQTPIPAGQRSPQTTVKKHVLPQPMSIRPRASARPSTAQAGPLHSGWKPLNELPSLSLVDRNGQAASLPDNTKHWLLLYRTATCIPCDRLMLALQEDGSTELKGGKPFVVVVDNADPAALERVHAGFAGLSDATWVGDREKALATSLKLHGAPVLIAMDGRRVAWRVAGTLDSTSTMVQMTNSWLEKNAAPEGQTTSASWKRPSQVATTPEATTAPTPRP